MSLLMDALKKAEQDKKKAAERLRQVEESAYREVKKESTLETSESVSRPDQDTGDDSGKKQILPDTVEFTLQPIPESRTDKLLGDTQGTAFEGDETQQAAVVDDTDQHADIPDTTDGIVSSSDSLSDSAEIEELSTDIPSAPFDDTFHGIAFKDEPEQTEIFKETLPGVPATDLIRDIGGGKEQPTPVVAQTVFTAGAKSRSGQSIKWSVILVLGVVAILAYGTFYYFTITPVTVDIPSPLITREISTDVMPPAEMAIPGDIDTDVSKMVETNDRETQTETMAEQVIPDEITSAVTKTEPEQIADIQVAGTTEASVELEDEKAEILTEPQVIEQQPVMDEDISDQQAVIAANEQINVNEQVELETVPDDITIQPALIEISKTSSPEQHSVVITMAYSAYINNRYDEAETAYREVLAEKPENRDALLGLAAIAIKKENYELAYNQYLHLLELNPSDSIALTALVNLSGKSDPVKSESTIKSLLNKDPQADYLYFTLGNIYASQLRWFEAQQAFFNAYRLDSDNPDYALNLAVSLDHIGQQKTALEYYNVALRLADLGAPGFNTTSVISRVQALSGVVPSQL